MSDIAIRVENLGKAYKISHNTGRGRYKTLQEDVIGLLKRPFSRNGASSTEMFWALKDVSFEVKQGEVLGIIGRNGAGKSTLLKILSRITRPTTGYAEMYGRIGSLLEVGTGFHPELTGRENIFLNGAVLGMTRRDIQRKFDEIVQFAEVEQFLDTPVKRYSSGMYMRLAFAVAAHLEPEILVVDEVLAVGDAEFQKKSLGKMDEVAKSGRTVLFVSHNLQTVRALCKTGIFLDAGEIRERASVHVVTGAYIKSMNETYASSHTTRSTAGKRAILDGMRIWGAGSTEDNVIEAGSCATVEFKIVCLTRIERLNVGLSIHDEGSETVNISYSGPGITFDLSQGTHYLQAKVPSLSLTPGLYTLRGRIEADSEELDWPKGDLAEFHVVLPEGSYVSRAESLTNGLLYIAPNWAIAAPEHNGA